jgi:hypothetical protein
LWSAESLPELVSALKEVAHRRQHPVFYAEVLWAATRDKLPRQAATSIIDRVSAKALGPLGKLIELTNA